MASLRNEVNMARLVTHPHVCRIHDFHWDPARSLPFVTMELVQGETLAQRLRRDGPLSHEAATPIVDRMLSALEAAHSNGVIHRDLKPANVMLTDLGQVKVMDFGLAREVHRGRDLKSTLLTNALAGTPAYMAPEQLRGETATIASDIHSMGVVLFEVVTGRRPFEGATPLEIASRRLHEDSPPPRKYNSRVDRRWNYTIVRCLEREPSRRPTSVAEVRRCLVQRPPISRRTWIGGLAATISVGGAATFLQLRKNSAVIEVFDIENRTHDAALDYLCKGTTSELMRRLAQVASLRVIAAHAARSQSAPHGGGFALYGVAQTVAGSIRLKVQLDDTSANRAVWLGEFDRKRLDNLLEVQGEIAAGVVTKLRLIGKTSPRIMLASAEGPDMPGSPTTSTAAFDLYLRGNSLLQEASRDSIRPAIDYFQRAVHEDSSFALAYASMAEAHLALRNFGDTPDSELAATARELAQKAVGMDPNLAEGYTALAAVRQLEWNWTDSEANYDTALRLKPNFPRARRWRAGLLLQFARVSEAIADEERAYEEDPYDRMAVPLHGRVYLFADRCAEAAKILERGIADRDMPVARYNLSQAYARLGRFSSGASSAEYYQKALAEADKVATIERRDPAVASELSTYMYSLIYSIRGNLAQAQPYLDRLAQAVASRRASPIHLAMAYSSQGNVAAGLQLIDDAFALRDRFLMYLRVNIFLENLRGQPRFESILRKLNLT